MAGRKTAIILGSEGKIKRGSIEESRKKEDRGMSLSAQ